MGRAGRAEALLVAAIAALALFVGAQVARRPATSAATSLTTSAGGNTSGNTSAGAIAGAGARAGADSLHLDVAPREALHARPARWPDRRAQPLRVWVQPGSLIAGFDARYEQLARDAFDEWRDGALPLRFDFVLDSATSDIRVTWIDRFPVARGRQVGSTARTTDQDGWIAAATLVVAAHDSAGAPLTAPEMAGVLRHEAGHALGLGHSANPETLMYPSERVTEIREPDRVALRLLYTLPPGPAREQR